MFLPPAFSKRQWEGAVLQPNETVYCSICTSSPERESIRLDFRASLASLIALNPKWKAQLCFSRGDSADGKKFALIFHIRANTERAVETKSQFLRLAKPWLRIQIISIYHSIKTPPAPATTFAIWAKIITNWSRLLPFVLKSSQTDHLFCVLRCKSLLNGFLEYYSKAHLNTGNMIGLWRRSLMFVVAVRGEAFAVQVWSENNLPTMGNFPNEQYHLLGNPQNTT